MRRTALAVALLALPAQADEDSALISFSVMRPEVALKLAQAALLDCREKGYQVGVAVVDRFGVTQVFLRDQFAGPHVEETARRKAWTAVSFRTDTLTLAEQTAPGAISAGIRDLDEALALGGGVPVSAAGSLVGGIGVSGAPGPDLDDACAQAGVAVIEEEINF